MNANKLPAGAVAAVCLLTALPSLLGLLGWKLDFQHVQIPFDVFPEKNLKPQIEAYYNLAGAFLHTILEWTAFCTAIVTGLFSFVHYRLKRDVTTPIIGTALFFSGLLDAFNVLAADRLTFPVLDLNRFLPFTWAVSRTFNVAILLAGTLPFLLRRKTMQRRTQPQELRYLLLVGFLFGLMAYAIIQIFAVVIEVPESLFPKSPVPRPWDLIPLVLWLGAGVIVLPMFWKLHPSLFAHALLISAFPAVAAQLHMAFGSTALFDHHFVCAHILKILAYGVPFIGLLLDYGNAHRADVALRETETKLAAARQIALSLLPPDQQEAKGLEAAGFSYASEAVGGDYYDFLHLSENRFAAVVGDVSGHDLAASILASQSRAYLRAYADSLPDLSDVMTRLNNALVIDTQQRRFVTMFCAIVSGDRHSLVYAAAGHQGYLIHKDETVETLDSNFLPLGMTDQGQVEISELTNLKSGDMLLIVTDGITEALSPQGEQYGLARVLEFLKHNSKQPVPKIIEALRADVDTFCHGQPPADDVTVVLLRWNT